jgi:hypothetical protein
LARRILDDAACAALQHFAGTQKPPTQRHVGEKCGIIAAKRNAPA